MIFQKDERALRRTEGRYDGLGQSLCLVFASSLLSCDNSQSSLLMKLSGRGSLTAELVLENLSLGRGGYRLSFWAAQNTIFPLFQKVFG